MAIRYYDDALASKIQRWIKDPNLRVLKPDETTRLFQITLDENNDSGIKLPLVAISREPSINIDITNKRNFTFDGVKVEATEVQTKQLNAVPITLNYQLDIYTKYSDEADEYLRNFIFNFINYPKMVINIPYNNSNIEHICYVKLLQTATDNSDIAERLFPGQFTRWTLNLAINDAYLFSVPINKNWTIDEEIPVISSDE